MKTGLTTPEARDQLVAELRAEGVTDPKWIEYLLRSLEPGGEKEVLPGETREAAVARLMRHYGWDERAAEWTIALSEGLSDLVPVDDDGNEFPYYRDRDQIEAAEGEAQEPADRP